MDTNQKAVTLRGVTKTYGSGQARVTALRGIDLEVRVGELLMLVGPSGSGKTTLISVIAGILDQDQGQCLVFDRDLKRMSGREKTSYRGHNIGFVFQTFNLLPPLTALWNVAVPLLINRLGRAQALEKARQVLTRVGLGDRIHSFPAELSGGQQQRVAIARAMVHDPKLIVCDEPTSSLDHETGGKVMALLRAVAVGPDRALVIVTHDSRIFEFADRIASLDDGRVVKVEEAPARRPPAAGGEADQRRG
jgi:putative ABC transport system ATP-binding protein